MSQPDFQRRVYLIVDTAYGEQLGGLPAYTALEIIGCASDAALVELDLRVTEQTARSFVATRGLRPSVAPSS
ncbi:hypothetical protein [Hymenobacter jeollabukensis]|uniref:Uncharacterized protein n=1 Tax=Hymenobacter jeollabukensis TaxID=2025313 RepID=A0A5R8WP95_9BACT|nr:hypothetical protein [Hymenobacter jeollabukensis]TLM91907.1 hypothetical protein FDY95_15255 [Hymenobacter jeollabukensis]